MALLSHLILCHPDSSGFPLGLWYFIVRHPSGASPAAQLSGNPIILSVREALSVYPCPILRRPAVVWGTRCRRVGETDRETIVVRQDAGYLQQAKQQMKDGKDT